MAKCGDRHLLTHAWLTRVLSRDMVHLTFWVVTCSQGGIACVGTRVSLFWDHGSAEISPPELTVVPIATCTKRTAPGQQGWSGVVWWQADRIRYAYLAAWPSRRRRAERPGQSKPECVPDTQGVCAFHCTFHRVIDLHTWQHCPLGAGNQNATCNQTRQRLKALYAARNVRTRSVKLAWSHGDPPHAFMPFPGLINPALMKRSAKRKPRKAAIVEKMP